MQLLLSIMPTSSLTLSVVSDQYGDPSELSVLSLKNKMLTDIADIRHMKRLTRVDLSFNAITALTPLATLTAITQLTLNNNKIHNIKPVRSLIQLTTLNIAHNRIHSLDHIAPLRRLTALIANNNVIATLPNTLPISLTTLVLSHNKCASATPLHRLVKLSKLSLSHNALTSIAPDIAHNSALVELRLNGNHIAAIPPAITALTRLKLLDVGNNKLTDIGAIKILSALPYLRNLNVAGNAAAFTADVILTHMPLLAVVNSQRIHRTRSAPTNAADDETNKLASEDDTDTAANVPARAFVADDSPDSDGDITDLSALTSKSLKRKQDDVVSALTSAANKLKSAQTAPWNAT